MDPSTILISLGVMVGLVALFGGLVWFDVIKQGNSPHEPTGSTALPSEELGPTWTPGASSWDVSSSGWDGGGLPGGADGGGGDAGGGGG